MDTSYKLWINLQLYLIPILIVTFSSFLFIYHLLCVDEDDELSFRAEEHIFEIEQIDEGWWLGRNADGQFGLFPANYVKLMM